LYQTLLCGLSSGTFVLGFYQALPVAFLDSEVSKAGRNPPTGQAVSRKVFNQP